MASSPVKSTENSFPNLFSPLEVGSFKLRNRIISSANFTALAEDNLPSERFAYYHAEKAKGGLALTITGELAASPTSRFSLPRSIHAYDPRSIPGFRLMTEMVHKYGGLAVGQLQHAGSRQYGFDPYNLSIKIASAPSQIPTTVDPDGYSVPRPLNEGQIQEELRYYTLTATNLIEAGFDGVEIKSDSSSLPVQFLSPLTNRRTDRYGGSFENRLRFLDMVIEEVYKATAGKKLLGIKIPGSEFHKDGLSQEEIQNVARHLDRLSKIDYVSVGGGNLGFDPDLNTPSAYFPQGLFVPLAEGIRRVVSQRMKVMTLGRIVDPSFAEEVLASGKADLVIMMRANIADPELAKKAIEGRVSEIIPCVGCNQGCLYHVLTNRSTTCILNPTIGREKEWGMGTLEKTSSPKNILIVGAGPAGLECARIAAMRGHIVTIFEQSGRIGGQVNLAAGLPGRSDMARAITFWESELKRLRIRVYLHKRADENAIIDEKPDIVVCATGIRSGTRVFSPAFPDPKGLEFTKEASELTSAQIAGIGGKKVILYDDRGDFQALGWAEAFATAGAQVLILTRHAMVAPFVEPWTRLTACKRLFAQGVQFLPDTCLAEIRSDSVTYFNVYTAKEQIIESDYTYCVSWPVSEESLFNSLKESKKFKVYSIGDCVAPRSIEEAVFEGHSLARQL